MKKSKIKATVIFCLWLLTVNKSFAAQVDQKTDTTKHFSIGINGIYLQNRKFSKTLMLGASVFRGTNRNWLKLYGASNYFEYSTVGSFGGLNFSIGVEAGTGFSLNFGKHFYSTLLTGIGYHRLHQFDSNLALKQNAFALFGSVNVSYSFRKFDLGILVGSSIGRGKVTSSFYDESIKQENLFSYMPKLGIQFKYNL